MKKTQKEIDIIVNSFNFIEDDPDVLVDKVLAHQEKTIIKRLEELKSKIYVSEGATIGPLYTMGLNSAVESIHKLIDKEIESVKKEYTNE